MSVRVYVCVYVCVCMYVVCMYVPQNTNEPFLQNAISDLNDLIRKRKLLFFPRMLPSGFSISGLDFELLINEYFLYKTFNF